MEARKVTEIENTLGKLDILIVRSGNILDHTPEELKSTVPKSAHARYFKTSTLWGVHSVLIFCSAFRRLLG